MQGVPEAPKADSSRFGFWTVLASSSAIVTGGSCGAVSAAENADGFESSYVHLGLAWDRESAAMGVVALVIFVQGFLTLIGIVRAASGRTTGVAFSTALAAFVFAVFATPSALPAWRRLGCRLGAAEACLAASRAAPEPQQSELEATACDRGVAQACVLVAAKHEEQRPALCEKQRARCKGESSWSIYCTGVEQLCDHEK